MVHIGVHPVSSIQQLLQRCDAQLIGMNDTHMAALVRENPALIMTAIPADTYRGQTQRLETLGSQAVLVVTEELDEQTAYAIIDALYSNPRRVRGAHSALYLKPVDLSKEKIGGAKLHPGSVRYFSTR